MQVDKFFDLPSGEVANLYTIKGTNGVSAKISDFGAVIFELNAPDKNGKIVDVMLGYKEPTDYIANGSCQGALVGRVANRVKNATFTLNDKKYDLVVNKGPHSLHGGLSYARRLWTMSKHSENSVELTLFSPDGDAGYPGNLNVVVSYTIEDDNTFTLDMRATTDAPTIVNLTNHAYMNLSGESNGIIADHELAVYSDTRQEVEPEWLVPTGNLLKVANTPYDINTLTSFEETLKSLPAGFDTSYVFENSGEKRHQATVLSKTSGIQVDLYSTDCALQLYTAVGLNGSVIGKSGRPLGSLEAFCLETQHLVDSPNNPQFPSIVLNPGEEYHQTACYKFSVVK